MSATFPALPPTFVRPGFGDVPVGAVVAFAGDSAGAHIEASGWMPCDGRTLAAASTLEKDLGVIGKNNVEAATKVGAAMAERAKKAGVEECYFDRGGFLFHGKIKALAEAAREGGLKF